MPSNKDNETFQPEMLVWDKHSNSWKKFAFNREFGLRGVRQTAELLRNNGIPACAVPRRAVSHVEGR